MITYFSETGFTAQCTLHRKTIFSNLNSRHPCFREVASIPQHLQFSKPFWKSFGRKVFALQAGNSSHWKLNLNLTSHAVSPQNRTFNKTRIFPYTISLSGVSHLLLVSSCGAVTTFPPFSPCLWHCEGDSNCTSFLHNVNYTLLNF